MEDYLKKGEVVTRKGDVYPGDAAMTKKMRKSSRTTSNNSKIPGTFSKRGVRR
jgi:hypothetical protein